MSLDVGLSAARPSSEGSRADVGGLQRPAPGRAELDLEHYHRIAHSLSAHQFEVLRILAAAGPSTVAEVAGGWPHQWLDRSPSLRPRLPRLLLRTFWQLEQLGYLRSDDPGRYQLTPDGAQRVQDQRTDRPG